jgi:hypothetical protein
MDERDKLLDELLWQLAGRPVLERLISNQGTGHDHNQTTTTQGDQEEAIDPEETTPKEGGEVG